ncbi:hypothetical protein [Cellulomonas denverensis]|uniref:Uncharacterized protein n=1 Tax=Cellulomonas denverensis TaxID=264297 RepID=A0A7X6KYN5_9CELL|nr:hypothetical protein [Cellulomonas denverensis]NKY24409.1 hypothetical protein [Cellulomonas denverensis]GIG26496.1 hypothetical protein Cde04nite_27400 [Cellulomonas denverensis]
MQNTTSDGYTIATVDGRGDVSVIAQVDDHDLTGPSPEIVRAGNRMLLQAAVARQIICPFTDTVLDVSSAVLITVPAGRSFVMNADHWDQRGPAFLAAHPGTEVIDGRAL